MSGPGYPDSDIRAWISRRGCSGPDIHARISSQDIRAPISSPGYVNLIFGPGCSDLDMSAGYPGQNIKAWMTGPGDAGADIHARMYRRACPCLDIQPGYPGVDIWSRIPGSSFLGPRDIWPRYLGFNFWPRYRGLAVWTCICGLDMWHGYMGLDIQSWIDRAWISRPGYAGSGYRGRDPSPHLWAQICWLKYPSLEI